MKTKCITTELLADFIEGRLPQKEREQVERHLLACEICLESASVCMALIHGEADAAIEEVPERLTQRAVSSVLTIEKKIDKKNFAEIATRSLANLKEAGRCLWDGLGFGFFGEPAFVRSGEPDREPGLVVIDKDFEKLSVKIEIEKGGEASAHITLHIQRKINEMASVRVALFMGEREVASVLSRNDVAQFEDISFGSYCIILSYNSEVIGEYAFKLSGDERV